MNEARAIEIIKYESDENDKEMWRSTKNGARGKIPSDIIFSLFEKGYIEIQANKLERPFAFRLTQKGWDIDN